MEEKERYEIHIYDDCNVDLYNNGVLDESITDTWKLEKLLNQQDKKIIKLKEENQQLRQQLNSQPAEIVGKIRSKCCVEDKCKDGSFVLGINEKDLDTILKEYQK